MLKSLLELRSELLWRNKGTFSDLARLCSFDVSIDVSEAFWPKLFGCVGGGDRRRLAGARNARRGSFQNRWLNEIAPSKLEEDVISPTEKWTRENGLWWLGSLVGHGYGNRSQRDADCQAVLISIFRTLKQRGHNSIQIITTALALYLTTGQLPPLSTPKSTASG